MPRAAATTIFTVSEGVACGETLYDAGAGQFNERAEESAYAGSLFQCYSRPELGDRLGVGGPRVVVLDVRGEELEEAAGGTLASLGDI
jgi:hypothetical protein